MLKWFIRSLLFISVVIGSSGKLLAIVPVPDHVVIVVLENHGYGQIVGSAAAPYINGLINDPYGALFSQSYALSHPSQPNYLQLFSGSNQGVIDDFVPAVLPFITPNLGAALLAAGKTFVGYSEDLPSVGYTGATSGSYVRKHAPWINWQGAATNGIAATLNQPLTAFPSNFTLLPTVSFVIPTLVNDMHDGTDPSRITNCDTWVQTKLDAYAQWAKTHNSLLIVTFDEDDGASAQRIPTIFLGNMVQHASYANTITHYNVLRMLEDMYGLSHSGSAATSTTIDYCWNMCNQLQPSVTPAGPLVLCFGNTQTLTASSGASYLWSTGATTQSVSVSAAGSYSVTVSVVGGCTRTTSPVVVTTSTANSSAVVFTETMGSTASTTLIPVYETANSFDNDGFTMSGTADVRNTTPSTGYAGASGLGNVFITSTVGKNFIISGINTASMINLQLSFGVNKSSLSGDGSDLLVQVSTNGTVYTNLSFPALPTGTGTAGSTWNYRTITAGIPASSTLSLQFKQNGIATQYRIDDIKLTAAAGPTIAASGPTTFCNGGSVTLTASSGTNYLWSNGATTQSISATTPGSYVVTVDCVPSAATTVTVNNCNVTLNLKAFIQGFYLGAGVQQAVADPSGHPLVCDTVIVELHSVTSPYSIVYSSTGVLGTNGLGSFIFPVAALGNSYFVVMHHRNSIETWSKNSVAFVTSSIALDMTVPDNTASTNPLPVLTNISPSTAVAGSAAFTLTVTGSSFISSSVVKWNGVALTTTYVSSTQLTVAVPATNIISTGTSPVTVFNPTPGGGTSAGVNFVVSATNPLPVLTSISPATAVAGSAAFTLTVTGSSFISSSVVKWNGVALTTTYVSSTQLTAAVPAANSIAAGTSTVTVFTSTPGGGTSAGANFVVTSSGPVAKKFLFDATKAETAGNADWVIDQDASVTRYPTPAQSNVIASTPENYWTGAISSWGIALAKKGYSVESLPTSGSITYGNVSNAQDLSNYDVFVVDEPNILFTAAEKTAIIQFVNNGGGLCMIADHTISDRNNDGWDSPDIWNDLMTNNSIQSNPFGFSIDLTNITEVSSNILSTWSSNTILNGSEGAVTQLEFNNGATITTNTVANPTVNGLIWQTGFTQNGTHAMCATSTYGTGRVFVVTDSSPMDDGTGNPADNLFPGWTSFSHSKLFMNASLWLAKIQ